MASYPSAVKTFSTRSAGQTIGSAHVNDLQDEINALEAALLTSGLAHHVFPDATTRTLGTSANPWGTTFISALAYIGDTSNANMTGGLTVNQGAADNEILAFKSSDIAHGVTTLVETDTYASFGKIVGANGGLLIRAISETGNNDAFQVQAVGGASGSTAKSTAATANFLFDASLISGTGKTALGANENLAVFRNDTTARFILDGDGDSHQDVGTAWTNFDDRDDVLTLTALSAAVSREGDPVREAFRHLIADHREALEAAKLVTFNEDGHHFINWSRTMMLAIGAIRQQGQQVAAICAHLGLPPAHGVQLLPEGR